MNYVSSDWHGAQWAWDLVKEFLGSDNKLFYLGDATDRGSGFNNDGGWAMLKEMLADPRVVYLRGNHDVMLSDSICRPNDYKTINLHWANGGGMTINAAASDPTAREMAYQIRKLPTHITYTNPNGEVIFMSHSGSTDLDDEYSLIWDRNEYLTTLNFTDYDYVIHGHTRAGHIMKDLKNLNEFLPDEKKFAVPEYKGGAYWYYTWRCTVDCATIMTNQIVLLDLDTFDEHIFKGE